MNQDVLDLRAQSYAKYWQRVENPRVGGADSQYLIHAAPSAFLHLSFTSHSPVRLRNFLHFAERPAASRPDSCEVVWL